MYQQKRAQESGQTNLDREQITAEFVAQIRERLKNGSLLRVGINAPATFDLTQPANATGEFEHLQLSGGPISGSLDQLHIRNLFLQHAGPTAARVRGCWIDTLVLGSTHNVEIIDCWIGTLRCGPFIAGLSVSGGGILCIDCPPADGDNPFTGSVFFERNVFFPRKAGGRVIDAQPYRNMRAHMAKLENSPMVSLFHVLELVVERKKERRGFTRFISWLYEVLSNCGGSVGRPFGIWVALMVLTCMILFLGNAVVVTPRSHNWLSGLANSSHWRALERGALLTLEGTFNPLGIFGTTGIVSPKYVWAAVVMFVHGVFSATLAALFVVGLRRRFKMG
ncbi:MAG TPA: hypothetical protein VGR52_03010 [Stellaceae bacterium]|nr:hypothetical protein [Stellaceae bacterium]